jgi:hypothetical protein
VFWVDPLSGVRSLSRLVPRTDGGRLVRDRCSSDCCRQARRRRRARRVSLARWLTPEPAVRADLVVRVCSPSASPNPLPFPCEGAVAARVLLCATRDTRRRVSSERAAGEWAVPDGGHLQRFSPCEPEQIASERRRVQGPTSLMRRCSSGTRVCQEFDFRLRSAAGFGETRHFGGGDSDAEPEREQQDDHGPAHASRRARETSGRVRPSCRG